jgi:hypothetical protein
VAERPADTRISVTERPKQLTLVNLHQEKAALFFQEPFFHFYFNRGMAFSGAISLDSIPSERNVNV